MNSDEGLDNTKAESVACRHRDGRSSAHAKARPGTRNAALGVAALAAALRLLLLWRQGGLFNDIEYDDGVHLGSSLLLAHGHLLYRDDVFLHPPGISILLLPFAAVSSWLGQPTAFALARLAAIVVSAVNTGLLVRIVARSQPLSRAVAAGTFAAIFSPSIVAGATLMLEPLLGLFSLLAVLRLTRQPAASRDSCWAGGLLAAATLTKAWGVIPLVAVVGRLLLERRRSEARNVAVAATATCAIVISPFLIAAPGSLVRDVVWTQLRRPAAGLQGMLTRIASLVSPHGPIAGSDRLGAVGVLVALALLAACGIRRTGPGRVSALVVLVALPIFANGPSFYFHYGDFFTPWLALLLTTTVIPTGRPVKVIAVMLGGALALGMAHQTIRVLRRQPPATIDLAKLQRLIGPGCVASEQVSLLLLADAFDRPGCPSWLDPRGTALTQLPTPVPRNFYPFGFRQLTGWQRQYLEFVAPADQLLLAGAPCEHAEWAPTTCQWVLDHFTLTGTAGNAGPSQLAVQVWSRKRT